MKQVNLLNYRRALLAVGRRLQGALSHLTGAVALEYGRPVDRGPAFVDPHADYWDQEVTAGLLRTEVDTLEEIAAALARIEEGTFGQCEECNQPIPEARLQVLPYARHCISCAQEVERSKRYA
jgi:RNA polymerase-binding transcription factor DksA